MVPVELKIWGDDMEKKFTIEKMRGGIIVSCQALPDEPLYGSDIMAKMAKAAEIGGAVGVRANTIEDIITIKKTTELPVIGIIKKEYMGFEPYITPTILEVSQLVSTNIDIIAVDATNRLRPGDLSPEKFLKLIKKSYNILVMADISTYEEGIAAAEYGADIISTTLSGYTSYSIQNDGPDFNLIRKLSRSVNIPVIAEGRIESPEQAGKCIIEGAFAVVVGGAITRPQLIIRRYADFLKEYVS